MRKGRDGGKNRGPLRHCQQSTAQTPTAGTPNTCANLLVARGAGIKLKIRRIQSAFKEDSRNLLIQVWIFLLHTIIHTIRAVIVKKGKLGWRPVKHKIQGFQK